MRMVRTLALAMGALGLLYAAPLTVADTPSPDGIWTALTVMPQEQQDAQPWVRPARFQAARLDERVMRAALATAPLERTPDAANPLRITLPTPDGGFEAFDIVEYSMMEPGLAEKFPEFKTYLGQGVDSPASNVHLDFLPQGFHAQVLSPLGTWSIDPYSLGDTAHYASYFVADLVRDVEWECHTQPDYVPVPDEPYVGRATGSTLRSYRFACAAAASFTAFHGGTVAGGQAAIVTGINRVNQVYMNEFSARLVLVANNSNLVYTNDATDPYTDGNLSTMLGQNQSTCNSVIGSANYDIGHIVSGQNLGGLAFLRALCSSTNKARGGTGISPPVNDFFWVKYVCHELGHQFGANHSFNAGDGGTCQNNRNGATAYEPGSGSTIMSYLGLCGANNNLQGSTDPVFNQGAYAEAAAHMSGTGGCSSNASTGNTAPSVNAGPDRAIPVGTPFVMTPSSVSDVNGDSLTFSWEERDTGVAQPASGTGSADNGTSPIFRAWLPASSSSRFFPRLSTILGGTPVIGEQYPAVSRTLRLRLTVRDNRAGGGGVNTDDVILSVSSGAGPFTVTSPNTNVSWSGLQTVTWNVANTTASPVSCSGVNILLSTDAGATFPTVLLSNTPNDGTAQVTIPNTPTSIARIKVEAVGNVFFDVSNVNFTITGPPAPDSPTDVTATPTTVCPGGSTQLSATVPAGHTVDWYTEGCGLTFIGTGTTLIYSPTISQLYRARTRQISGGLVSSSCSNVFVSMGQEPAVLSHPSGQTVNPGDLASLSVAASGTVPLTYTWRRNGTPLFNGGSLSGANTNTLTIFPVAQQDAGAYDVVVTNDCDSATSTAAQLNVTGGGTNCSPDFDGDGDMGTDADIEAFFACLAGSCCPTCGSADFDGDGDIGTDADIEAFFRVLGGGDC
jgi:hypothetical protein